MLDPCSAVLLARERWASNDEVSIDLFLIGQEMRHSMHWGGASVRKSWVLEFERLGKMEKKELAEARQWIEAPYDAKMAREFLSDPRCGALDAGRRYWAQALSLSGILGGPADGEAQFVNALGILSSWFVDKHPGFDKGPRPQRELQFEIDRVRVGICEEALSSLASFAEAAGVQNGVALTFAALEKKALGRVWRDAPPWSAGNAAGLSSQGLASVVEKAWMQSEIAKASEPPVRNGHRL